VNSTKVAGRPADVVGRLKFLTDSSLVRQNLTLFVGGLVAGVGGFAYHALAAHELGPKGYGEVASLIALYSIGTSVNLVLILVLARYAATLQAQGKMGAIRQLMVRSSVIVALPAAAVVLLAVVMAPQVQSFEKLGSPTPVVWLGIALAVIWFVSVPRGLLQGTQRFASLSLNLGGELVVRTGFLVLLLSVGLGVSGAMIAVLIGAGAAYVAGMFGQRHLPPRQPGSVHLRTMLGFTFTAVIGTVGILILYNLDVILAKHFLSPQQAGIYGGLNKIATITYFLTLSVSQVLFPRVVEAVARRGHPGRLLLLSAAITGTLGLGAILVFAVVPGLIVKVLFGPAFDSAIPLVLPVGFIGLGLSLDNLLIQFFMAVHDRVFVPILVLACAALAVLIALFHAGVASIVVDLAAVIYVLLVTLALRAVRLMPQLRPEMVADTP